MEKLKMLIPTDFSVQAEFGYLMVKKLSEKMPTEIHFLHVLPAPDSVTMDASGNINASDDLDIGFLNTQKDIALRKLAQLKTLYGEDIQTHLTLGKLQDEIVHFSVIHHFDLIVMGTKGAWGIKEKLSGSETQITARKSHVPLLSLMCDRSDLQIKNILFVHDFNDIAVENLHFMKKCLKAFDAKLNMLQVVKGEAAANQKDVEQKMKKFAELNAIENYEAHVISDATIESGVTHFNQMKQMDVLFIGTHGKSGLFHHSVTETLINHLFKPIVSFQLNNK